MEAQIDMKVKLLFLLLALTVFSTTAWAQDPGIPDTLILQWSHVPDLSSGDSSATLELVCVNDEAIGSMSAGFKWIPVAMTMDSAKASPISTAAFQNIIIFYRNNKDSTNANQKFQFVGIRFLPTEIPAGRNLIATYYFKLNQSADSIVVDTSAFTKMALVTPTNVEFTPVFAGAAVHRMLAVEVLDNGNLPTDFNLAQNYPNPFNPETTIDFALPKASSVELTIYNVLGQKVVTLLNETLPAGRYRETWHGTSESGGEVASGIYFYRLTAGDYVTTKKMMLLK